MSKVRVGLGMICKDEVEDIKRILSSYGKLFDEIQITITSPDKRKELEEVITSFGGTPSYYDWKAEGHKLFPFDLARNFNKEQFKKSDYYLRMDCDDELAGEQNIRSIAQKALDQDVSLVLCFYDYAKDEWGNVIAGHNRETLIKCTDNLFWNKRIHENVLCKDGYENVVVIEKSIKTIHRSSHEKSEESNKRNIEYLIEEYNQDKEKTDPRTLAYLGRVFFGVGDFEKAVFFLQKHIEKSGWDEDRYLSWCYLSELFYLQNDYDKAISCATEAMIERPDYPNAYHQLSYLYCLKEKYKKAIEFGLIGASKKAPESTMIVDPSANTFRPAVTMALAYFHEGDFVKANRLFRYAKSLAPSHPFIKQNEAMFGKAIDHKNFVEKFVWIMNYLKLNDKDKMKDLAKAIPEELLEEPTMAGIKNTFAESNQWADNSIVFFCGSCWEDWSPKSVKDGIGGSEEAVINMANEFTKLGYQVTVYNSCGEDEGVYDGVRYINHYKFNKKDVFNILITWRNNAFMFGLKAKKRFLWIHDVPGSLLNHPDEKAQTDKAIVLSEYHKSLLVDKFPADKCFVSTNGVNYEQFNGKEVKRDPYRMIYASSHLRGIEHLLRAWKEIKEAVPQANLHLYYGWNTYDKMVTLDSADGSAKAIIEPLTHQDGITEHGRVGHEELAEEYLKAGIWVYPSHFPEISCIAAMKAQVAGCVPVCTDYAALAETVKAGVVIPGNASDPKVFEDFKNALIDVLTNHEYQEEVRKEVLKHRDEFSWADVALQWHRDLFSIEGREYIDDRLKWVQEQCGKDDKIVDIGGNKGHTFYGWNRDNVTTVDIDKYDIPNFVQADATNLPFEDKSFDIACLDEVLEHMPDPVSALKEAKRVARKKIIITVPNEHEWFKFQEPMMTIEDKMKLEGLTREELARKGNTAVEFYTGDNYEHLYHVRYYTLDMVKEHLMLAGIENYTIKKLNQDVWAFYGVIVEL